MYHLFIANDREMKIATGVHKNIVDKIRHKDYVDVLSGKGLMRNNMKRIQSRLQKIGNYDACKIPLSCFDDMLERYILDNDICSLAYFHIDVLD